MSRLLAFAFAQFKKSRRDTLYARKKHMSVDRASHDRATRHYYGRGHSPRNGR